MSLFFTPPDQSFYLGNFPCPEIVSVTIQHAPQFLHGLRVLFVSDVHLRPGVSNERLQALMNLIAAKAGGTPAWVRIRWNDPVLAKPVLDMGADGVIIARPFVSMMYGGGEEAIQFYVEKIGAELAETMTMCGASNLQEITRDMVRLPK